MKLKEMKKLRLGLNMTQGDVAKALGVSLTSVQLWEKEITSPTPYNLKKLKKLLKEENI